MANCKIVASLTVYNEEKRIAKTLESLKDFDEIVVQDKSSTDATVEIAKKYGAIVRTIELTDDLEKIFNPDWFNSITESDWTLQLTCSDVVHPELYKCMVNYISNNDVDYVEVPFYRYSMGFISRKSFYGSYDHRGILYKKIIKIPKKDIHVDANFVEGSKGGKLDLADKKIAVYHLTHENMELILERHLRYAEIEAKCFETREVGLKRCWYEIVRQIYYYYIKLRTWKLKEKGKAQLCMLLMYRCAKYLNVYFDKQTQDEITKTYDEIRNLRFENIKEE